MTVTHGNTEMNEQADTPITEQEENRLITERRGKLNALRDGGQAYPNDFRKNSISTDLHTRFCDALAEELEAIDESFSVAGRIMAKMSVTALRMVWGSMPCSSL